MKLVGKYRCVTDVVLKAAIVSIVHDNHNYETQFTSDSVSPSAVIADTEVVITTGTLLVDVTIHVQWDHDYYWYASANNY